MTWILRVLVITSLSLNFCFAYFSIRATNSIRHKKESLFLTRVTLNTFVSTHVYNEHLASALLSFSRGCKVIAQSIATAPISGMTGTLSAQNSFGEDQKKLDVISNDIIKKELKKSSNVCLIATEEDEHPIVLNPVTVDGLVVVYDPLDGSSNIDCAIPTGTIFGMYNTLGNTADPLDNILQKGSQIICGGYCMYSSSIEFVFSVGNGTHGFTLDPSTQEFILTRENIVCPPRGPFYSLNEGRSSDWPQGLRRYIADIKDGESAWGKRYSSRYVCSLVADVHRTLLYGGWAGNPRKHLRFLYEAAPLSFIAEQSGGLGSDGSRRILDITPMSLNHRLPVFIGSKDDILELVSYGDVQQLEERKYEA